MRDTGRGSHRRRGCRGAGFLLTYAAFLTRNSSSAMSATEARAGVGGGVGGRVGVGRNVGEAGARGGERGVVRGEPTTFSGESISRMAFGSCNKQYLPQPMWKIVEDLSPDVWLWIGDAVYVDKFSDGGVKKMKEAFAKQLANKDYQRFLEKVPRVEGVWDDHDYGVNDAGKELSDHPGRVEAFLDFLGVGPEDPRRGAASLYSSHVFGEAPKQVKVLMMDIRTQRDGYHAFNIAHRKFKFAAMIGAMLRWFSSSFCLGSGYDGSVVGEEQWEWLEEQLTDSEASVHVLVSTLQVKCYILGGGGGGGRGEGEGGGDGAGLAGMAGRGGGGGGVLTSNPLVESWGHFPRSRKRLLDLLQRTDPAGLVILSGDVHHAELASGWQASPPAPSTGTAAGSADSVPPGHPSLEDMMASGGGSGERRGGGCPFSKRSAPEKCIGDCTTTTTATAATATTDSDTTTATTPATALNSCAAHSRVGGSGGDGGWGGDGGGGEGRGVVEVTTSGMTHSCLSSHGKTMCEAYLQRWRQHRWRDDAYFIDRNFGDIDIEWAEDENAAQPAKMTVTVRDTNGTPILPVVEHFGGGRKAVDLVENPRGEGEATVGAEGGDGLGVQEQQEEQQQTGRKILDRSQRQHSERTFLDRPPPSECVEPVLPAGCTARKFSALGVCALALVLSYIGLARGARARRAAGGEGGPACTIAVTTRNGDRNDPQNGSLNGLRNGSMSCSQNSLQNGSQNGSQNGLSNASQNGSHNGTHNGSQNGAQNGSKNGKRNGS
eukprot:jgi/Undpi1/245/HiC_scaffold_1.g00242.m1